MTEEEWLAGRDLHGMLRFLHYARCLRSRQQVDGKVKLLACHCLRSVRHLLFDERSQQVMKTADLYIQGSAAIQDLATLREEAEAAHQGAAAQVNTAFFGGRVIHRHALALKWAAAAAMFVAGSTQRMLPSGRPRGGHWTWSGPTGQVVAVVNAALSCEANEAGDKEQIQERLRAIKGHKWLLYELFGNPFRVVEIDEAWRTRAVLNLSDRMDEAQDYRDMPALSVALEKAGCSAQPVLAHCREPIEHVRGCWVIDLLLDRSWPG
jgi:hypothetical protein